MLGATQEDIARGRPLDAGLEPAGEIEKDDRSAVGRAAMQQGRADGHVAETEDRAEVKQRHLKARLAFEFDLQRLVVEMQITPRRLDIQRVEKLMHDATPGQGSAGRLAGGRRSRRGNARHEPARALPSVTVGRHDSRREHLSQRASLTASGSRPERIMARTRRIASSTADRNAGPMATSRRRREVW